MLTTKYNYIQVVCIALQNFIIQFNETSTTISLVMAFNGAKIKLRMSKNYKIKYNTTVM